MPQSIAEMQKDLESIVKTLRNLRGRKGKVTSSWVERVKNPLIGYVMLHGPDALRALGKPREEWDGDMDGWKEGYRGLYFEDIKYRSKLRKLRDKIKVLEKEYYRKLDALKNAVYSAVPN